MSDIFAALGGVAALVAIGAFIGKLVLEKFAEGTLKRFEESLAVAARNHQAELARQAEAHQAFIRFSAAVDTDLRSRRAEVYGQLWKLTSIVARWPRNTRLQYREVTRFSQSLRSWYYDTGGMYLSGAARKAYGDVQEANAAVAEKGLSGTVSDDDYDALMVACSTLRTSLTEDLRSRGELPSAPPADSLLPRP